MDLQGGDLHYLFDAGHPFTRQILFVLGGALVVDVVIITDKPDLIAQKLKDSKTLFKWDPLNRTGQFWSGEEVILLGLSTAMERVKGLRFKYVIWACQDVEPDLRLMSEVNLRAG